MSPGRDQPGTGQDHPTHSTTPKRTMTMLDWILNPYGIDLGAYVILWIALLVMVPVAIIVGVVKTISERRKDRGDG
jgi:hypothetical protein